MAPDLTHAPTPRTLDLTGLPEPVVEQVTRLVHEARAKQAEAAPRSPNQPRRDITMDDSRESIHEGCG